MKCVEWSVTDDSDKPRKYGFVRSTGTTATMYDPLALYHRRGTYGSGRGSGGEMVENISEEPEIDHCARSPNEFVNANFKFR